MKAAEMAVEYDVAGYRHCANIGRWHKSNNIRMVALLSRGVHFQVCHDPDCRDFKSADRALPLDCQPLLALYQDEDDDEERVLVEVCQRYEEGSVAMPDDEDDILLKAVEIMESNS